MKKENLIKRLKSNKVFRKATSALTFAAITATPLVTFAAASPESKYKAAINGIANLMIGLSIPAAICACVVYAIMYKFAGTNGHKKAEIIDSIKGTGGILVFILTAGVLLNWVASLVK